MKEEFLDETKILGKNTKYVSLPKLICKTLDINKGDTLRITVEKVGGTPE